jgi:hypothetical protein
MTENENTTNVVSRPKKKKFFKKYFALILILLVIVLSLTSAYFYKKSTVNNNQVSQKEIKSLVEKVGRLVVLPTDETPTIATVSDPEALKNQPFFNGAKKGDKVLIYSNAKKAILYDPALDKIVTIASLNNDINTKEISPSTTVTPDTTKTEKKN